MNTRTLAFIALLTLSACGKANTPDPVIQGLVNDFVSDAAAHGRNLQVNTIIVFGDTAKISGNSEAVGDCSPGPNGGTIILDQTHWNLIDSWAKKMIIYHELGHCVLSRTHNPEMEQAIDMENFTVQVAVSIMNPSAPQANLIGDTYTQALVDELFK